MFTIVGSKIVFVLICCKLVGLFVSAEGNTSSSSSDGTILGAVLGSICVMLVVVTCLIIVVCCKSKMCSVQPNEDVQRNTTNITVKSAAGLCSNSTKELNFCNLDAGTIVGMVIGGIVAILLIVIVILLACSHIRMLENGDNLIHDLTVSTNPLGRSGQPPRYTRRTNNRNTEQPTEQPVTV
ncbi:uncharacterized protein LOC127735521 [Mytilus californianus]|uniref:uncharacterized protein LOC127735521 n=1 Tax=Mytilus californianus TaxID=6549 RepID=UPI002245DCD6|nr:uncharacterized protein LOC127735521 [Mytilus californianus]